MLLSVFVSCAHNPVADPGLGVWGLFISLFLKSLSCADQEQTNACVAYIWAQEVMNNLCLTVLSPPLSAIFLVLPGFQRLFWSSSLLCWVFGHLTLLAHVQLCVGPAKGQREHENNEGSLAPQLYWSDKGFCPSEFWLLQTCTTTSIRLLGQEYMRKRKQKQNRDFFFLQCEC